MRKNEKLFNAIKFNFHVMLSKHNKRMGRVRVTTEVFQQDL